MKKGIFATVALVLAVLGGRGILAPSGAASAQTQTSLPTFELDKTWPPKLPNGWVMGQMSSVAIDKRDHVWLLHRPRFIPAEQSAHRAPPVLEFDATGKFVQGWGGPGAGYDGPRTNTASSSTIRTSSGSAVRREQARVSSSTGRSPTSVFPSMTTCCSSSRPRESSCSRSAGRMPVVETRTRTI